MVGVADAMVQEDSKLKVEVASQFRTSTFFILIKKTIKYIININVNEIKNKYKFSIIILLNKKHDFSKDEKPWYHLYLTLKF